ncbi:hypothetical protein ABFT23_01075 [Nocardioides sp. C4-1]|uniref:tRNA adenosine deaminase-associated protein n=1 Tax=Nocardioides sp. C4-1 TaxID=3151851 RepID=UPI00326622D7
MVEQLDDVDFALAAWRRSGEWVVGELAHDLPADLDLLADALRRFSDDVVVALIGLDDDYFVIVRVDQVRTRVLLSDPTAADEWDVAASVLEFLDLPAPDEDDDDQDAVGDLDLLADLGLAEDDLEDLLDDVDAYPDELLSDVARAMGFGQLFDDALGLAPA